jgi:ubiquinone/menaquinone biosynthesis C-methylase UbiE
MPFQDLFSTQAAAYADIRPDYPAALFEFLCSTVPHRTVAWDCATGNGQAAVALAAYFDRVIATDASAEQLTHARPNPRVEYRVATAENSGLPAASIALTTVAQALHWFDLEKFYAEVKRVLVPDGVIAVWSYGDPNIIDAPSLDASLQEFNFGTMGSYWPSGRGKVGAGYLQMAFPFAELPTPSLVIERDWTLGELAQYLRTWSARARYLAQHGTDPVAPFEERLAVSWGGAAVRHRLRWPLTIRAGRRSA